jgi:hypothetical protein
MITHVSEDYIACIFKEEEQAREAVSFTFCLLLSGYSLALRFISEDGGSTLHVPVAVGKPLLDYKEVQVFFFSDSFKATLTTKNKINKAAITKNQTFMNILPRISAQKSGLD